MTQHPTLTRDAPQTSRRAPTKLMGGITAGIVLLGLAAGGLVAAAPLSGASGAPSSELGTVVSVARATDSFTLKTASGSTIKVKVTAGTTYHDTSVKSPSFADVVRGQSVAVIGTSAAGVDTAISVILGGHPGASGPGGGFFAGHRPGTFGKVTSVSKGAKTFTVKTFTGSTVKVRVTGSTSYRDRTAKGSFSEIKVGAEVAVTGKTSSGVVTASSVVVGLDFGGFHRPTTS